MSKVSERHLITAALLVLCIASTACIPTIAKFSAGATVPSVVASHAPTQSQILVLPLWHDTGMYHFHSPYVIPASAIGTPDAAVPKRIGMYLDSLVCGGPNTYVLGYLVAVDTGTVIWSDALADRVATDRHTLKAELRTLILRGKLGPALRNLIQYELIPISFDVSDHDRTIAMSFVEGIHEEQ